MYFPRSLPGGSCRCALLLLALLAVAGLWGAAAGGAWAQQQAVCPDPPGNPATGNRVLCDEDDWDSTDDVTIRLNGFDIETDGRTLRGVAGIHQGKSGSVAIDVTGGDIETKKDNSQGIYGRHTGAGKLDIDITGVDIETAGSGSYGVQGFHESTGELTIDVDGGSTIDTDGNNAYGVYGRRTSTGTGGMTIGVDGGSIDTAGDYGRAIYGEHQGTGNIDIDAAGVDIDTSGERARAINAVALGGNIDIGVSGGSILTKDKYSYGIYADQRSGQSARSAKGGTAVRVSGGASIETEGDGSWAVDALDTGAHNTGDTDIDVYGGAALETQGNTAGGIRGRIAGADSTGDLAIDVYGRATVTMHGTSADAKGVFGYNSGKSSTGDIDIAIYGGAAITTNAAGIHAWNWGSDSTGDIDIDVYGGATVTTKGTGADIYAAGIYALNYGASSTGGIDIGVSGGASVSTAGAGAYGLYGLKYGASATGGIGIEVTGAATVTTQGEGAHGIYAGYVSGGAMAVTVGAGSTVSASGAKASGVQIGRFNKTTNALERAAGVTDGYRDQTVTVDGSVRGGSGEAAGVYLAGGGKVFIGPQGTVGAKSGIAVIAARKDTAEDAPALYIALNPGGRAMADVLDGGWIVNDGGETTIVVNGVVLHDGKTGATGLRAPDGARYVTIREKGVTMDRSTKPGSLAASAPSAATILDRDFSAADFIVIGGYTPGAAVYEALPGFLLRLDGGGIHARGAGAAGALYGPAATASDRAQASGPVAIVPGGRMRTPGSPLWIRVGGGFGRYAARQADAGARYRFRRYEAEAGMDFPLAEDVAGFVSARLAFGSADVTSPGGRGKISALGYGFAAGAEWRGPDGVFAAGRLSAMRYSLDLDSAERGRLASGATAWAFGYRAEAGRRLALGALGAAPCT